MMFQNIIKIIVKKKGNGNGKGKIRYRIEYGDRYAIIVGFYKEILIIFISALLYLFDYV